MILGFVCRIPGSIENDIEINPAHDTALRLEGAWLAARKTWDDELVNTLAYINRQGLGRTIKEQKKYHAQANRELESAEAAYVHSKWYDPRRQAARKRWQRAESRAAAQREMWTKISLVRSLFY